MPCRATSPKVRVHNSEVMVQINNHISGIQKITLFKTNAINQSERRPNKSSEVFHICVCCRAVVSWKGVACCQTFLMRPAIGVKWIIDIDGVVASGLLSLANCLCVCVCVHTCELRYGTYISTVMQCPHFSNFGHSKEIFCFCFPHQMHVNLSAIGFFIVPSSVGGSQWRDCLGHKGL